jgi:hypothetical protein
MDDELPRQDVRISKSVYSTQAEKIMKIYVAGPMTVGNRFANVRAAIDIGVKLMNMGHDVYIPHLNDFVDLVHPQTEETWIRQNFAWIDVCDALYRIEGYSVGADREVERASYQGKRIFYELREVPLPEAQSLP